MTGNRAWRSYDQFRTDVDAPARLAHIGTRTPILSNDGGDVAAAIETIREIGDGRALAAAVSSKRHFVTLHKKEI